MKKIKYILLLLFFVSLHLGQVVAQSPGLNKILDGIEEKDGVTSILITKKMFELFTKTTDLDVKGESLNEVIGNLDKLMIYDVHLSTS